MFVSGSPLFLGAGERVDGYWMVYRTVCRTPLSGRGAQIVRPWRFNCPAKALWLYGRFMDGSGGFTDGLSDIAVSAFNVVIVRFCG